MYSTNYSLNRKLLGGADLLKLVGADLLKLVGAHQHTLNAIDAAQISSRRIVPQISNNKSRFYNTMDSESDKPFQNEDAEDRATRINEN